MKDSTYRFFTGLIANSQNSNGEIMADKTPHDISKVIYERLTDAIAGDVKIFFYSAGKAGNNKPYKLTQKISPKQFMDILILQDQLRESKITEEIDTIDLFNIPQSAEKVVPVQGISKEDKQQLIDAGLYNIEGR